MNKSHKMLNYLKGICLSLTVTLFLGFLMVNSYASEETTVSDSFDKMIMVSMGDSYSSGEGIPPFYGQRDEDGNELDISDKVINDDWLAHRSTLSWPGMLKLPGVSGTMADHKDENWFFVAASGATTNNIENDFKKTYFRGIFCQGEKYLDSQLSG